MGVGGDGGGRLESCALGVGGIEFRVGVESPTGFQLPGTLTANVNKVNACFPFGFIFTFAWWRKGSLNDLGAH